MILKRKSAMAREIEWRESVSDWHPFFCLKPRRIDSETVAWLETIERKLKWGEWYYRLPENLPK